MQKIKVAVISQSMNIGGGETMAARLAAYIDREKFDVKLFILGPEKNNQISDFLKSSGIAYECLGISTNFQLKGYLKLSRRLRAFGPDLIHEHLDFAYSWIWCWLHRCPLAATMHGDPFRMKNAKVLKIISLKSRQGDLRVIGCSQITARQSKDRFVLPEDQVGFVYNPLNTKDYQFAEPYDGSGPFVFLHVGRFNPVKNHKLLLEAFALAKRSIPGAVLRLAGDGKLLEEMKQYAKSLKIDDSVEFCGNVTDIPVFLQQGHALVLSSVSEACPMVVLEAMATGLPVAATNVGGVPELVTDNGLLVESGNVEALAGAMISLAEDPLLWQKLSACAQKNVRAFDSCKIARDYEEEYLTLVKRK